MMDRRRFLASSTLLSAGSLLGIQHGSWAATSASSSWRMPDEAESHVRTWMAFGASKSIWGKKLLPVVQRNLASIAKAIARYEPVSMLVREEDEAIARDLLGSANVTLVKAALDDLWIRDTGPVFVTIAAGQKAGVNFNFNGWGEKQEFEQDAGVASLVTKTAGVPTLATDLVLEGGGIEVDGHGTAIITESCVLNDNRNPGVSKAECETELKRLLGLQKIIWLPGSKGQDITDGHTDFYARFARSGVVVAGFDPDPQSFDHAVTKHHLEILKTATDAQGKQLEVAVITAPVDIRPTYATDDFAAGYINFYVCNGAVIAPEFGDAKADKAAYDTLRQLYPDRDLVQLNIDGVAAGGGGIHCTTQQEPK